MDRARADKKDRQEAQDAPTAEVKAVAAPAQPLLEVQRLAGNRAASAMVQSDLVVGAANDPAEHEADQIAARIVGGEPDVASRTASPPGGDPSGAGGGAVDAETAERVERASRGGRGLDGAMREKAEAATGASLGDVRLHDDRESHALSEKFGAAAFTVGQDIFFGSGAGASGSAKREQVLAHEVGHTVQNSDGVQRKFVRRVLIEEAERAFKTTIPVNPNFADVRTIVDNLVPASDQKKLTKIHGFQLFGKKETEQERQLADGIRSVLLGEYVQRLEALESNDKLTEKEKAKKRAVYIKKADELREKLAPLLKKGAVAPEARNLLADYGLDSIAEPTKKQTAKQMASGPRIDVRSTFIGGPILGVRVRAHLFIVYTSREGKQLYFRGGPGEDGNTEADWGEYTSDTVDYDPSAPSVTVLEGPAAAAKLDRLIEATMVINGMKVPYQAQISKEYGGDKPNLLQKAATYGAMLTSNEGENCNATAWTILSRAGVKAEKPFGKHPGWGSILGSHTPGKENAMPAAETLDPGKRRKYKFDPERDQFNNKGMVQIYWDRGCTERQTIVAGDTEVELLEERGISRRVMVHGKEGFVPRAEKDKERRQEAINLQALAKRMENDLTGFDMKGVAKAPDDAPHPHLAWLANEWQMEEETILAACRFVYKGSDEKLGERLQQKLEFYGKDKMKQVLTDQFEIDELAKETGAKPSQVYDAIIAFVGKLDLKEKVAAALGKHMEVKQALYLYLSDLPAFEVLKEVAEECSLDLDTVFEIACEMAPPSLVPLSDLVDDFNISTLRDIANGKNPVKAKELADRAFVPVDFVMKRIGRYVGGGKVEPPKVEDKPKAITEDDKKLKLYIDMPNGKGYDRPSTFATSPTQITEVVQDEGAYLYVKTTLDQWPFWIALDDLKRFAEAHNVDLDDEVEDVVEDLTEDDEVDDTPSRVPVEDIKPLTVYEESDLKGPKWGEATDPDNIMEVGGGSEWTEITFKDYGAFVWVRTDEYQAWLKKHGK